MSIFPVLIILLVGALVCWRCRWGCACSNRSGPA